MTREELLQLINLKQEHISANRPNRHGVIINPEKITIHNTSNSSPGADANAHSKFVRETGYYILHDSNGQEKKNWVSWHYTVDDKVAINHLPLNEKALHAGSTANKTSIAIEICMHKGIDQETANNKAAQLAALLCFDYSIPISGIVPHKHWIDKNCPELLLKNWNDFLNLVRQYWEQLDKERRLETVITGSAEPLTPVSFEMPLCWMVSSAGSKPVELDNPLSSTYYGVKQSFNEKFLESGDVTLPAYENQSPLRKDYSFIHHQNLSIYFNKGRKLALYTACNFDKDSLIVMNRSEAFQDDSMIDAFFQLGKGFYGSDTLNISQNQKYFDRGHIIARRYNQWGSNHDEARAGERDTYYFTTIHPQVGELNKDEWEKLESFIIGEGKLDVKKVSIIAGTILDSDDPVATYIDTYYKQTLTIQIPKAFWKIVYYEVNNELRKIAFLMSQRNRLKEIPFVKFKPTERLAPDPFDEIDDPLKTYIIKSSLIEKSIGLVFSNANELYDMDEPLEVLMESNETHPSLIRRTPGSILRFI